MMFGQYGKFCISSYSKKMIIFLGVRTIKKYFLGEMPLYKLIKWNYDDR